MQRAQIFVINARHLKTFAIGNDGRNFFLEVWKDRYAETRAIWKFIE
jgi:hypothetical protein